MQKLDEILERLTRIEVLLGERDKQCTGHTDRLQRLEKTVNGNGKIGLAEEVRTMKTRFAWLIAGVTFAVNVAAQMLVRML